MKDSSFSMVGDHGEIPFWLLKKYFLHFTYFITIFVKAVCQAVSKPFTSIQSINQPINYSYIFVAFLHTLGALRHDEN